MDVFLDENNWLSVRKTPWNDFVANGPSNEILDYRFGHLREFNVLLNMLDAENAEQAIQLTLARIRSSDKGVKIALQENDYFFIDTVLRLQLPSLLPLLERPYKKIPIEMAAEADFEKIQSMAQSLFHYSRYLEDPRIPESRARLLYARAIDDFKQQGLRFYVHKEQGCVTHFIVVSVVAKKATLLLGGSEVDKSIYAIYFWYSVLLSLQAEVGVTCVETQVHSCHYESLRLHALLGFKPAETLYGFHKNYQKDRWDGA